MLFRSAACDVGEVAVEVFFEAAGFAQADAAADFDLFEVEVAPVLVLCGKLSVWEGFCGLEAEAVFARFKGGIGEMGGGVGVGRVQGVGFFETAQGFFEVFVFAGLAVEEVVGIAGKVVCAAAVGQGEGAAQEFALCFAGGEFGNFEYQGRIAGVEDAAGAVEVVEGIFFHVGAVCGLGCSGGYGLANLTDRKSVV